jgi:hypothetical protein
MVSSALKYIHLATMATKVLHSAWKLYEESTPDERQTIIRHLNAISDILRNVYRRTRGGTVPALPMLPALATGKHSEFLRRKRHKRFTEHVRRFRQSTRQFVKLIRECQSSFTVQEAKQIAWHLDEIRKVLSAIRRRERFGENPSCARRQPQ